MRLFNSLLGLSISISAAGTIDPISIKAAFLNELLTRSPEYGGFTNLSSTAEGIPLKVGIVGAGAAGMYAGILLDSLGIDYDIIEANNRIGGRVYTHRSNQTAWDLSKSGEPDFYDY